MPTPWSVASSRMFSPSTTATPIGSDRSVKPANCQTLDGAAASSHVAFGLSEISLLYDAQITQVDSSKVAKRNCFGSVCMTQEMDTTIGAGTALVGTLAAGSLSSVICSSASFVQMQPTVHKLAVKRQAVVFHTQCQKVEADNLAASSDYADVLLNSSTGAGLLHSRSIQECHDLALIAHLVADRTSLPFVHFYDQCSTGSEVSKSNLLNYSKMSQVASSLVNKEKNETPVSKKEVPQVVDEVMASMRRVLKRRYNLFEYSGSNNADTVIVSLCNSQDTAALEASVSVLRKQGHRVGLLNIRLLRPWSVQHFLRALPVSTLRKIAVVVSTEDLAAARTVLSNVSASLSTHVQGIQVLSTEFEGELNLHSGIHLVQSMQEPGTSHHLRIKADANASPVVLRDHIAKSIVWESTSRKASSAIELAKALGDSSNFYVHASEKSSTYAMGGAVSCAHVHLSEHQFARPSSAAQADAVVVRDARIADQFDVMAQLKYGGVVVLNTPASNKDEMESTIPGAFRRDVAARNLQLFTIDMSKVTEEHADLVTQAILLLTSRLFREQHDAIVLLESELLEPLAALHGVEEKQLLDIVNGTLKALKKVEVPESWVADGLIPTDVEGETQTTNLAETITKTSLIRAPVEIRQKPSLELSSWSEAAKHLLFPEAYDLKEGLRPDEHAKTYVVKVTKNERLTPSDYERNVFHIEFDTTNTNLTYKIGEALGVYGHNQKEDVHEFIDFYGLNANDSVTILNHGGHGKEVRTVEQVLTQYLDICGRPSRRFYEALAPFATSEAEQKRLEKLSGSDGAAEFKKRVEATVTFMDVLKEFSTARPTFAELCDLIPRIKARHYSIASSQKMHPTSVHLLVVLVAWKNPDGKQRFGQCTKYLVDLKPGTPVTVDIMPSVLKLPEDPTRPIAMAGLGTGMAPFRAFIQERAAQHAAGIKVGPMALYFGSRSQKQEYLYGEELEAYHASGLLTHLHCAFSRDQPEKIYIQHKLQGDAKVLSDFLQQDTGSFFLCGPTWPAGDVQDAIEAAFKEHGQISMKEAQEKVAELKKEQRYILEVY